MANLPQKQIEAIIKLPAPKKYSHFIKETVGSDAIWILYRGEVREGDFKDSELADCEYFLLGDDHSNIYLPLWPAEDYVQLLKNTDTGLEDFKPLCIGVEQFLEEYLPYFLEHNVKMCVFPTPDYQGVIPAIEDLIRDLNIELSRYE